MNTNILPSDRASLLGVVDAQSLAAGSSVSTGWVSMQDIGFLMAVIAIGQLGAAATLDGLIEQATDSSGTGSKAVTGKAITQIVDGGNEDSQVIINVNESDLDFTNSFTHARLTLTAATQTALVAAFLFGFDPNDYPKDHAATVVEVV